MKRDASKVLKVFPNGRKEERTKEVAFGQELKKRIRSLIAERKEQTCISGCWKGMNNFGRVDAVPRESRVLLRWTVWLEPSVQ